MPETNSDPSSLLNKIIITAIDSHASDVHIEPETDSVEIRIRVDGLLQKIDSLSKFTQEQIISRVKILSQMDITIHGLPQDGHFEFKQNDRIYSIRVSTIPSSYGENIVLRIHNRDDLLLDLRGLGFDSNQTELIQKIISNPSGMIIISGPTGSGKTSLLYSIISALNKPERNIVTLEDPVEYQIAKVRQSDINEATGLTFARSMRAILRQDPDIVMVGEIRDPETAQMAIQAALTGTLVLTTFHTFDASALLLRLTEMGASSSIVAQSINAVVSTRLLRKICQSCQTIPYEPNELEKKIYTPEELKGPFVKGQGCAACMNRGYSGRIGVFEIVHFDNDIKANIIDKRPMTELRELIKKKIVKTLKQSAFEKVQAGITTLEEVTRVIGAAGQ